MSNSWYAIKNATDSEAEISIYEMIGGWGVTARQFVSDLKRVTAKKINLRIHSPGGSVFEGNAIYNALRRHPSAITTHIDGLAASMASVIALAGDTVKMARNGLFMIHNPSAGCDGDAEAMRKRAELLDKVKDSLMSAYEEKTGIGRDELARMMDEETWLTAQEALEKGFVDEITDPIDATACTQFDFSNLGFKRTPEALADATQEQRVDTQKQSMATAVTNSKLTPLQLEVLVNDLNRQIQDLKNQVSADPSKETQKEQEAKASADVTAITKERDQLKADLQARDTEISNLKASVSNLTAERDQLKSNQKSAGQQAAEIVAGQGAEAVSGDTTTNADPAAPKNAQEFITAYNAIEDSAKAAAFFAKYSDLLAHR